MSAANLKLSKSAEFLERPVAKRKMGIVITGSISLLILLLSLPFITWINLANPGALFAAIGVKDYSNIYGGYSLFNFLSFVKESLCMPLLFISPLFHMPREQLLQAGPRRMFPCLRSHFQEVFPQYNQPLRRQEVLK